MKQLYPDRKMLKWQGFFLSEHQEAFSEEKNQLPLPELAEQSLQEVSKHLENAWKMKQRLLIQCKEVSVNGERTSFLATVEGFSDNVVFLLEKEQLHTVLIDQLQAVQDIEEAKWFQ